MYLHIVSNFSKNFNIQETVFNIIYNNSKSSLLFLEEGVYYISWQEFLKNEILCLKENKIKIFALEQDVLARGISVVDDYIKLIDYKQFVDLTEENSKILTW